MDKIVLISEEELRLIIRQELYTHQKTVHQTEVKKQSETPENETFVTVQTASTLLCLSVQTIYAMISKGGILPHYKKGKRLYFLPSELKIWLREGKVKGFNELQQEAENYIKRKNKKGNS